MIKIFFPAVGDGNYTVFSRCLCCSAPLGFLVIMHPSQMFVQEVKTLYNGILADGSSSINLKIQILKNLQTYLQEEDTRMQEADRECMEHCGCCCNLIEL